MSNARTLAVTHRQAAFFRRICGSHQALADRHERKVSRGGTSSPLTVRTCKDPLAVPSASTLVVTHRQEASTLAHMWFTPGTC